jgi:hypothetical protein
MYNAQLGKAAAYRRQAKETRRVADQISMSEPRNQLLEAAQQLDRLAEAEERMVQQITLPSDPILEA